MTPPPTSPAPLPQASAFAEALAQVVGTIFTYIFQRLHALAPIGPDVLNRISRANTRIQRLMARLAAGTWQAPRTRAQARGDGSDSGLASNPLLRQRRSCAAIAGDSVPLHNRTSQSAPESAPPAEPRPKTPYISQAHGWLGTKYGYFIRGYFLLVEHTLNKPETQALLAELPPEALKSLGRSVRPLCRLFAIQPPECLRLPPRAPKPRPKKPRKPRPRKLRLRTPKMPPYPTTSRTPWRIVKSKTSKFWG